MRRNSLDSICQLHKGFKVSTYIQFLVFLVLLISPCHRSYAQVVRYNFTGGLGTDDSGNGFNGSISGTPAYGDSLLISNSLLNYMTIPASPLNGQVEFLITVKLKFLQLNLNGSSPTNSILSGDDGIFAGSFAAAYQKSVNKWRLALNNNVFDFIDSSVVANQWYCITFLRTAQGEIKFYKDGVRHPQTHFFSAPLNIANIILGQENDCVTGCFALNQVLNGIIDFLYLNNFSEFPQAGINATTSSVCNQFDVDFQALNVNPLMSYQWDFGDTSSLADSSITSTTHYQYPSAGSYQARLIVTGTNPCGLMQDTAFFTVTLNNNSTFITNNVTACNSYLTPWGETYTQSGAYTDTLSSQSGCDSIINTQLTILNTSQQQVNVSACNSYTATNGTIYSQDTVIVENYTAANGCDSMVTIQLDILPELQGQVNLKICESYTASNGLVYTEDAVITENYAATNGCDSVVTIFLDFNPLTDLSVFPNQLSIQSGDSVQLNTSGSAIQYSWSPAEGLSCSDCPNPWASPAFTTFFLVRAENAYGCISVDSVWIGVDKKCHDLFMPDIFTPNAEGPAVNEKLCAYTDCARIFSLIIFNRWGEQVFESTEIGRCWDGQFEGKPAQADIYAYRLYAELNDGTVVNKTGTLTLIR